MLKRLMRKRVFQANEYWESRYGRGGFSGDGSEGRLAKFNADVINGWVRDYGLTSVLDFGCGDGRQLRQYDIPHYIVLPQLDVEFLVWRIS